LSLIIASAPRSNKDSLGRRVRVRFLAAEYAIDGCGLAMIRISTLAGLSA